jgi:hypothetical protein
VRKAQVLSPIAEGDHNGLIAAGRAGKIAYRETWLGGCTKPGAACPLGGISNVSGCMGGDDERPCNDVLLDRQKRPQIEKLSIVIANRLIEAPEGSPLHQSLQAQQRSIENTLHVLDIN